MGPRASLLAPLAVVLLGAVLGFGASCDHHTARATHTATPQTPPPSVRVYFLVDLDGYLEPCGCQSRPLGGIDRIAHVMEAEHAAAPNTVFVAAGSTFFADPPLDARMAFQEQAKATALTTILSGLHLAAFAPGPGDFAAGAATWQTLSHALPATALAGNAGMQASVVVDVAGTRVGVVGVSDFQPADGVAAAGAPSSTDPVEAARSAVGAARAQGASVVVVLASVPRRTARTIAGSVPGVDFVIAARSDDGPVPLPERVGTAYLLTATNQGKGLGALDLYLHGDGPFTDVSEASLNAERARLDARIADLRQRVEAWSHDPSADAAAVATQRRHLDEFVRERASLTGTVPTQGRFFRERSIEIAPDVPRAPDVQQRIGDYFRAVNERNRVEYASVRAPPAPAGAAHYVGATTCENCHAEAYMFWQTTRHAHAYQTLVDVSKNFNLSCVGCHVTGYRQPGGSEVVQNDGLRDVQCETCHGPGSLHVDARTPADSIATIRRQVPTDFCATQCHTHEHSDRFDLATYRPQILGPGHGMPSADAGVSHAAAP